MTVILFVPHVFTNVPLFPPIGEFSAHRDDLVLCLSLYLLTFPPPAPPSTTLQLCGEEASSSLCNKHVVVSAECGCWLSREYIYCILCVHPLKKINWAFAVYAWDVQTDTTAEPSQWVPLLPCWRWVHICMQWSTEKFPSLCKFFLSAPCSLL